MNKEDFYQLAQNRNLYRIIKPLSGKLSHAKPGNKYYSDTLYRLDYNIIKLVEDGYLELVPRIFPFEEKIVEHNVNTIHVWCPQCLSFGINLPLNRTCGNCGYTEGMAFYSAEDIQNLIDNKLIHHSKL